MLWKVDDNYTQDKSKGLLFFIGENEYLILSTVLLVALALRVAAFIGLKNSIYFDFPILDERLYHKWAEKIAAGSFHSSSVYEFAPLPAYLMALIYRIFSPDILYIRFMNIIFGVLSCYLIYWVGKLLSNRSTIGLAACLVAALYKPFIFYSIVPLKASLSVFLFAATIALFLAVVKNNSKVLALLMGLAIGLMLNVRPQCIVVIPLLPLAIAYNHHRNGYPVKAVVTSVAMFVAGVLIAIAPFTFRNYSVSGEFALTTPQSGINLYLGNNLKNPDPYYRPAAFALPVPRKQNIHFTIEASKRSGHKLTPRQSSSYWTREVMRTAMQQPAAFLWKLGRKAVVFCQKFQPGNHYDLDFLGRYIPFLKIPFFSFTLIFPLGMAAMAVRLFTTRKLLALIAVFGAYAATLVIFYTKTRYRLPLLTILIPFAVLGIADLFSFLKDRQVKRAVIYLFAALAFFFVGLLPLKGSDDRTAYYNMHALILRSKGFLNHAQKFWQKSSRMDKPYSAFANLTLAGMHFKAREFDQATAYLNKINDDSFAAAPKYGLLGDILAGQGQNEPAIAAYQKSLDINSGQTRVRIKLIKLLWVVDKKQAVQERDQLKYVSSFYNVF